jgi:hypothetical protein
MRRFSSLPISALALSLFIAACASDEQQQPELSGATSSCEESPHSSVYAEAFDEYMVGLSPTPRRFLNAAGTDSALPEAVFTGIQRKGPAYLYPGDQAQRQAVLDKLSSVGAWPTLLVLWRGNEVVDDTTLAIRLAGHYVGGAEDGKQAPVKAMYFACDTVPWQYVRTAEEPAP